MDQVFFKRSEKRLTPGLEPYAIVHSGVIHQRINAAKARQHLAYRPGAFSLLAQVGDNQLTLRRDLLQPIHKPLLWLGVSDDDRHRPLFRQQLRYRRADPRAAAGDDNHFVFKK